MKTKHHHLIHAGLAAAMIIPAFALEGPADDAPPPQPAAATSTAPLPQFTLPPDGATRQAVPTPDKTTAGTAFLGVVSGEVPVYLADHLDLKPGHGVIVLALPPDSPAAVAGISVNDIITSVAGNSIRDQDDLSKQITRNNPGDRLELGIIHKGTPTTVSVTLGERPANLAMTTPPRLDQLNLDGLSKEMSDHIRDALGGARLSLNLGSGSSGNTDDLSPEIQDAIAGIQERLMRGGAMLDQIMPPAATPDASLQTQSCATFRMMDNDGSIEVKSNNGSKEVTVRDTSNGVVWSGPWNTDQERAAAPEEVRKRMESLNLDTSSNGAGLKFKFNKKAQDPYR